MDTNPQQQLLDSIFSLDVYMHVHGFTKYMYWYIVLFFKETESIYWDSYSQA